MCEDNVKVKPFESFCTSFYSIPLALASRKETLNKLRVCYNNSLRFFMGIGRFCSITEKFVILGIPTFNELLRKNIASLFLRLRQTSNRLLAAAFNTMYFKKSIMFLKWSNFIFTAS